MTKSIKLLIGFTILLIACWIYASPYLEVRGMKETVKSGDAVALADYVNFPALKESLKAGFTAQVMSSMEEIKDNPFAAFGAAIANVLINPMIETLVSPEGLAAMMNGKKPDLAIQQKEKIQNTHPGAEEMEPFIEMGYENFNRFIVKASDKVDTTQNITMVFLRDGLSWKLSAIRFPPPGSPITETIKPGK